MAPLPVRSFVLGLILLGLAAATSFAQEPRPVLLQATSFDAEGSVPLDFAWRYAPGDAPGREQPGCDDSRWTPVRPALQAADLPGGAWSGVGWFRRHLRISPELQAKTLALRFAAPGTARVFLDGRPVLSLGGDAAEIPSTRNDAALVSFAGPSHVLAVRYVYPAHAATTADGFGFRLSLSERPAAAPPGAWLVALRGAVVALPVFLALLHLALFSFDRRARENLFYALEMLTFAAIIVREPEFRTMLLPSDALRTFADRWGHGLPILAILFGALTYYALRTRPWPPSSRLVTAAGLFLYPLSFFAGRFVEYVWIPYFVAMVVEVVRLERSGRVVAREGTRYFTVTFAIFGLTIVLQILVNFGVLSSVAGIREVYVFGILASAVGMSLYLARTLGQSRVHEAENRRKSEELARARELQLSMLPAEMPRVAGLDVAAASQPATEVGGDYYDVRPAEDGALLCAFGDATGHGLAAGIVVTAAKALFSALPPGRSPVELLASCDRAMAAMRLPGLGMCLALARVSPQGVTLTTAAMPPLLVHRRASGTVEELGSGGLPLGRRMTRPYEEHSTAVAAGDTLLFASDGFAELSDPGGRQLGYDGVAAAFGRAARAGSAAEVVQRLLAEAAAFRSTAPQDDDITFLAVRVGDATR